MWISNCGHVFRVGGVRLHPTGVFSNVLMQKKRHYCQKTSDWSNSDILGLRLTSSLMWISNRGHVFRIGGIILHPTGVFSNVLMQKKRLDCRKTSDWSKSDCSVHGIYRQRYLVSYKMNRNDFLQGCIRCETVSSNEI